MPGFPAGNPAGGLFSTLNDMNKFLSFALGLSNSSLNSLRPALFTPLHPAGPNGKVALAWQINPLQGTTHPVIWKNGAVKGFQSYIGFIPETGNGLVILMNFHAAKMGSLSSMILKYLVEQPANGKLQDQKATPTTGAQGPGPVENTQQPKKIQ
jgi:CubicO group peptidase (beta-lactamase class C family)